MNNIKSEESVKKYNKVLVISLIPLLLYGFYKNGIKLYINDLVSIFEMFRPLLFDVIGFLSAILAVKVYDKIKKINNHSVFNTFYPFYGLLIASIVSINTNILLFSFLTFILLLISKLLNLKDINLVALISLLIIFISNLFKDFTFLNKYEIANNLNLNALDYFKGMGSGGINATCVLLLFLSLIILCKQKIYKKEIPLYSIISYFLCVMVYCIYKNDIGEIFAYLFSNNILFSYIYIASDSLSSPCTFKGKVIYSILVGVISFGLFLIYPPLASIGSILIASIFSKLLNKITF